ncbi:SDR family oxidoreductase [Alicyclobacillus fastidiosus]|uniref:SDR family oxidoreductase n=1 Tax=Alicyclobacillus fastidiosus TaxID=392011 RepID=A0ABY6ZJH9_9BACL|nr:SDR family oxidoreductase [Alicyclobacillus fastidiosus]WAH43029.1 SDR family oxidoreductase [Alicyclobacillus fastidiosus]GMA65007.1 D-mannonate oxidoreductase [Alicyclobacillus fastidiosus]
MNLFDLSGKTAVVIGGSGVLGSAIAEGLAGHGANVAIVGRDGEKAQRVVTTLENNGAVARAFLVDVLNRDSIESMAQSVIDWRHQVDILVNCAGVNSKTPFFEVSDDEWDHILSVNAKSIFVASQVFGRYMLERGSGSIINISSVSSGPPLSGVFAYSASKAALNSMTQYLAREFAPHVRVNAIIPGFFPAEQNRKILSEKRVEDILRHTPMARLGEAKELQGAAVWLASDAAAGFVTGSLVTVDGGFTAMSI